MSCAIFLENLTIAYHGHLILANITARIPRGALAALVGPNGAGKSTLLKSLVGLHTPQAGNILFFGKSYHEQRQDIAYMPQRAAVDWDFPATALDVVIMGRYGRLGWFKRPSLDDWRKAHEALALVGLTDYADRSISHLSGGQQQRLFLARALVQEASIFLLDEPFAGIDASSEQIIITLLQHLRDQGKTIIMVHHDIHTLHSYFDWALLIDRHHITSGPIGNIITQQTISRAYGTPL